jgi:hypothetical protein
MPPITMGSADILAQIMAKHQDDEFLSSVINDFIFRAKLKYDGLSRVFELSEATSTCWAKVRALETSIFEKEGRDELATKERIDCAWLQEEYRELQTELRRAQRVVEEQIYPEKK